MKLPIRFFRRFALKPRRRLSIERSMNKRLNTELSALRRVQPSPIGMANTLEAVREMTPPVQQQFRRRSRSRLFPKIYCGIAVTFFGVTAGYWAYIERPPVITEEWWATARKPIEGTPDPTVAPYPYPNAYEVYSIVATRVDLGDIGRLPHFDKAGEWEDAIRYTSGSDEIPLYDDKQIRQVAGTILKKNAKEVRTVRASLNSLYTDTGSREPYDYTKHKVGFKKLWSLLVLEASVSLKDKNYVQGANAALDALQFATQLQYNTSLMPKIIGMHWEATPRAFLWDTLPHLNATELRRVIKRLDAIMTMNQFTRIKYALMSERIQGNILLLRTFQEPRWRWNNANRYATEETSQWSKLWNFMQNCRYSKRQILANFDKTMQQEIQWSHGDFYKTRGKAMRARSNDPISELFVVDYSFALFRDTVIRNQNQLLMTKASILLYKTEKGVLPDSLADLSRQGKYLANNKHTDLFAVREKIKPQLRYVLKNGGYVLYSIGPDMKDNGGKDIYDSRQASPNAILTDSTGDIVAGSNRSFR